MASAPAGAVPIAGEYTLIDVTSIEALTGSGVSIGGLGITEIFSSPTVGVLLALLPVTGGDVDLPNSFAGTVEHAGSGLYFGFNSILFEFTDLVLDTTTMKVTATVASFIFNGVVELFNVVPCQSGPPGTCQPLPGDAVLPTGYGLRFAADAANLFTAGWGIGDVQNVQFGVANTALIPVPEPGAALLVAAGLVGLARAGRRRMAWPGPGLSP